jgi:hypothetical protein
LPSTSLISSFSFSSIGGRYGAGIERNRCGTPVGVANMRLTAPSSWSMECKNALGASDLMEYMSTEFDFMPQIPKNAFSMNIFVKFPILLSYKADAS